ncbi:multiple epidermal growth factor-like domains 10 [Plakobranchus ocellatus]|uniref:Multiple epidermal growth factor-like domains 10 n=1 Tax=Plakobranchus ocellatus TaxID=259542 RepID=A0AAV3YD68_9GAST|nr:multiple epidermal growth factor-like domains 10 [Plakobranchus ocellatus]
MFYSVTLTVCSIGTYGSNCLQKCSSHCGGPNNQCEPFYGTCNLGCETGFQPPLCDKVCPLGMYGSDCVLKCSSHCAGPYNRCDPFDGTCDQGCEPGYLPELCDKGEHDDF